jgi:hypothetical protein
MVVAGGTERRIGSAALRAALEWRMGPYGGPTVPTYWVWGSSGGAFDYPFADWQGSTGGWVIHSRSGAAIGF